MMIMNKKLLCVLCILLSVVTITSVACGKKKKDENNKGDKTTANAESVWENIGDYEIKSHADLDIAPQGKHDKLVGGCFDGERYAYYVLEGEDKTSVICKYDTKDNSLKKTSDTLNISDIEGICCRKNTLVILYEGKNVCVINNSSFETIENRSVIFEACGISYNKKSDRYTLLLKNGGISVMNSQFEQTFVISGIGTFSERSAITCNNKYIFTLTDTENGADLLVYDWSGNYVSTASVFDVRLTPVCLYSDDDTFYIGYDNENGGAVYKTVIEKR